MSVKITKRIFLFAALVAVSLVGVWAVQTLSFGSKASAQALETIKIGNRTFTRSHCGVNQFADGGACLSEEKLRELYGGGGSGGGGSGGGDNGGDNGGSGGDDAEDKDEPSCESEGGDMSWILCPVLGVFDSALEWLDRQITNMLTLPDSYLRNNQDMYKAWGRIRNIAFSILVPIMLVMVISTALGFEFISAYTVKRAMPRFAIAVLFIALSWQITTFLVSFFNDIGRGTAGIVQSSIAGAGTISLSELVHVNEGQGAATVGIGLIALVKGAVFAASGMSWGIILMYAGGAFLMLFIAYAVLVLRQMAIIFLALLAPLAILAWIFPGNDKLWKLWWGSFSKLLLMFPLIAGLIAMGKVFAKIVDASDAEGVGLLISLIAYVGPYFFIPSTFKFAGGIFATISGLAQDRGKGFRDNLVKKRQERFAENRASTLEGNRLGRNKFTRGIAEANRRSAFAGGWNPTKGGRDRYLAEKQKVLNRGAAKKAEEDALRAGGDDDAMDLLQRKGMNSEKFVSEYAKRAQKTAADNGEVLSDHDATRKAQRALKTAEVSFGAQMGTDMLRLAAGKAKATSVTGYSPGDGSEEAVQKMYGEMASDMAALVNDGLMTTTDAAATLKANKVRGDIGGVSFGKWVTTIDAATKKQAGGADSSNILTTEQVDGLTGSANNGLSAYQLISQRKETVIALAPSMFRDLDNAINDGNDELATEHAAKIDAVYQSMKSAAPQNAKVFKEMVMARKVGKSGVTVDQFVDNKRTDEEFQRWGREYAERAKDTIAREARYGSKSGGMSEAEIRAEQERMGQGREDR